MAKRSDFIPKFYNQRKEDFSSAKRDQIEKIYNEESDAKLAVSDGKTKDDMNSSISLETRINRLINVEKFVSLYSHIRYLS